MKKLKILPRISAACISIMAFICAFICFDSFDSLIRDISILNGFLAIIMFFSGMFAGLICGLFLTVVFHRNK